MNLTTIAGNETWLILIGIALVALLCRIFYVRGIGKAFRDGLNVAMLQAKQLEREISEKKDWDFVRFVMFTETIQTMVKSNYNNSVAFGYVTVDGLGIPHTRGKTPRELSQLGEEYKRIDSMLSVIGVSRHYCSASPYNPLDRFTGMASIDKLVKEFEEAIQNQKP
jgi:hypothetical protein